MLGVKTSLASRMKAPSMTIATSVDLTAQIRWETIDTAAERDSIEEVEMEVMTVSVTVPAWTVVRARYSEYRADLDLPYTATCTTTFQNGEIHVEQIAGVYKGIAVSDVQFDVTETPVTPREPPSPKACLDEAKVLEGTPEPLDAWLMLCKGMDCGGETEVIKKHPKMEKPTKVDVLLDMPFASPTGPSYAAQSVQVAGEGDLVRMGGLGRLNTHAPHVLTSS